ncbi:uncharacterized protein LOC134541308 isoform X5 [Bacillus rossius redtenbacheri]|uniref:uncharacterized protein LOC134541308 isoform X5 n=1 Tax=Bacillus rossius redtenbacheri TaxID=93214 RepID=UPI002FDD5E83
MKKAANEDLMLKQEPSEIVFPLIKEESVNELPADVDVCVKQEPSELGFPPIKEELDEPMSPPKITKMWSQQQMVRAIRAVRNKDMGYTRASKYFEVPRGTLESVETAGSQNPAVPLPARTTLCASNK